MKAFFVFPSSGGGYGINEYTEQPPLGIAYLAAALERSGFSSRVLDANFLNYGIDKIVSIIKEDTPDIVCLSLYAFNFQTGIALAEAIKIAMPNAIVIAGGAHPSALGNKVLEKVGAIDAVVVGEGEETLLEILRRMKEGLNPFEEIDGLIYRRGGSIVKNRRRAGIYNLDSLPFPAFHLFPELSLYKRRTAASPAAPILTSRGCPFECVFCSKSVFGREIRYRTAENVIAEIDYLVKKFKVRQLDIVDDNFITRKERATEVLEMLCKKPYRLSINLQSGVSATLVDEDILRLMKSAGVYRIAFGVESGNQRILDLIKKRQKLNDVARAVGLAKKFDMRTDAFFMIGLPGESQGTMRDTIDFAKKIDPHTANFHMVVPFPGTELYHQVKENGRFLKTTDGGIRSGYNYPSAFYEMGALKKEDVEIYYKKAYREFYIRPKKMMQTILSIRSMEEFIWLVKTAISVIFSMVKKREARNIR